MGKTRLYWNMKVEPRLGARRLDGERLRRLKSVLAYVAANSEYHRSRLGGLGKTLAKIRSFDEFRRLVPLFTKKDQRNAQEESQAKHGHAFGTTLCVPPENLRLFCATSGTTGEPTFYLFSDEDLNVWCEGRARAFWRAGLRPGMRVLIGFGLGMFVGGVPNVLAAQRFGMGVVPVGAEAGTTKLLKFASLTRPNALLATPSLAEHLIEKAPEVLGRSVREIGIRTLLLGGEPGVGIPPVKARLEEAYGAAVFDLQGPNMSCDAPEYSGMHRLVDDYYYYELIDPETKEPIEIADGATGELVTTQLWNGAAPFIRYTAGDLQQVFTEPCGCGKSGVRSKIIGRTDDMLKVKGIIVYPAAIKNVIAAFQPEVTGEFRILLDQPPPRVTPPLRLKVEHAAEVQIGKLQNLEGRLKERFHSSLKVTPEIAWVPPETLARTSAKKDYFERTYEGK